MSTRCGVESFSCQYLEHESLSCLLDGHYVTAIVDGEALTGIFHHDSHTIMDSRGDFGQYVPTGSHLAHSQEACSQDLEAFRKEASQW